MTRFSVILSHMKIGFDARMFGPATGGGGLGRYVEQIASRLHDADHAGSFVFFLGPKNAQALPGAKRVVTDIHWYGWREQVLLPRLMDRAGVDLLHFPHWNVPLFLKTPFVVTIHDLILLDEPMSSKASTRNPLLFWIKYAAFRLVLSHAVRASRQIIAVSETTKQAILRHFPKVPASKITVILEGVAGLPMGSGPALAPQPYLLYVGNAYPHKNVDGLLRAFRLTANAHPGVHLVLAGRSDAFRQRLKDSAEAKALGERVIFADDPTDEHLSVLYRDALGYVFPSRLEGFGLPPLEAMAAGVPVASSNTGSLLEVLGNAALYFDPTDEKALATAMNALIQDQALRTTLIARGQENITRFSWDRAAADTAAVYQQALP